MVVASAGSVTGNALDSAASAIIVAIAGRFRRKICNILFSPDVKAVKGRSSVVHAACYLGGVTRCNSTNIFRFTPAGRGVNRVLATSLLERVNSLAPLAPISLYKWIASFSYAVSVRIREPPAMNPANLPFDSEAMLQGLRSWVECESPTWDADAVEAMLDLAAREMAIMGASIERIAGRRGFAGCVRARFPHPKQGEPGILIAGHLDTVHPIGTIEKLTWRRDGNRCYGPGIFDMKGGNYLSLEAIRQLARASFTTPLPITVLFTPDEEVGTPSVRDLIEAEAGRNKYVLVPEPGRENNGVVTGRFAIARFNLEATGRPSHAGSPLSPGRFPIREMAGRILIIDGMTTEDCTFHA